MSVFHHPPFKNHSRGHSFIISIIPSENQLTSESQVSIMLAGLLWIPLKQILSPSVRAFKW